MTRKILSYLLLIFLLVLLINLVKSSWRLWHAGDIINREQDKLNNLKQQNEELKNKFDYYQSDTFVEEQARDKLQMAKEGEVVILLPEQLYQNTDEAQPTGPAEFEAVPNWKKWLNLFW